MACVPAHRPTAASGHSRWVPRLLANLVSLTVLSGCSLIYNPNNLDEAGPVDAPSRLDAMPDAEIRDADPTLLALSSVEPAELLEGEGDGGSPKGIVFVNGMHMVAGATISVTPTDPALADEVALTVGPTRVGIDGNSAAALITCKVMELFDDPAMRIPLTVRVTQNANGVETVAEIPWELRPLPELTDADVTSPVAQADLAPLYSRIVVTENVDFIGGAAISINAVADITFSSTLRANAPRANDTTSDFTAPGPGGCAGGMIGQPGNCEGAGTNGSEGTGGGGGGLGTAGVAGGMNPGSGGATHGDPQLAAFGTVDGNVSAGGGGGSIAPGLGGTAGAGGGGGGTIEITAGGTVVLGTLEAKGGPGQQATDGALGTGTVGAGGGGSGGVVLVRSGAMLTAPVVDVSGGAAGPSPDNPGGRGGVGRIRYDAPLGMAVARAGNPSAVRGPQISSLDDTRIFGVQTPSLRVAGEDGSSVSFVTIHAGTTSDILGTKTLTDSSTMIDPDVFDIGYTQICVLVEGAAAGSRPGRNCLGFARIAGE